MMTPLQVLIVLLCLVHFSGCRYGLADKHLPGLSCRTDIRTNRGVIGEDAIFQCPCGPNQAFHGYRATRWSEWPTSTADWRELTCVVGASQIINVVEDSDSEVTSNLMRQKKPAVMEPSLIPEELPGGEYLPNLIPNGFDDDDRAPDSIPPGNPDINTLRLFPEVDGVSYLIPDTEIPGRTVGPTKDFNLRRLAPLR